MSVVGLFKNRLRDSHKLTVGFHGIHSINATIPKQLNYNIKF